MLEGLGLSLDTVGAGGLVALIVILTLTGRLVSRKTLDKFITVVEAGKEEALKREQYYQKTIEKLQETNQLQQKQIDELMEQSRMTVALLDSLEHASRASRGRHHRADSELVR